ncbi:MAG: class II fructose-bisphosphate aldolase [Planctomycetia bacterium]|nr:class II fructose-bisphosphate aldolase [Planctomycetia bacterium]
MLVKFKDILSLAEAKSFAIPAFNSYNMETTIGIMQAAEESGSPVIIQAYSRLFEYGTAFYLAPTILKAAEESKVPVCFHLDHGTGEMPVMRALRYGCTGIMFDRSSLPFEENVTQTKRIVDLCDACGVGVEGELGHIGTTKEEVTEYVYTEVTDAVNFVSRTGVVALAIAVGTAHGRYKKAPEVNVSRIAEIHKAIPTSVVLHGGSGIPDEQVRDAIAAGIRKVNFGTDVCYSFLDKVFATSREVFAVDVFMRDAIGAVKDFALEKIRLLGSDGKAE